MSQGLYIPCLVNAPKIKDVLFSLTVQTNKLVSISTYVLHGFLASGGLRKNSTESLKHPKI